jgi:hypothetical protein
MIKGEGCGVMVKLPQHAPLSLQCLSIYKFLALKETPALLIVGWCIVC